jgi:ABC-2 type transport system permease protein
MSATAVVAVRTTTQNERVMPRTRVLRAYWQEAKYETLRMLRTPAFGLPFLTMPILLYLLFGRVIYGGPLSQDPKAAAFVFTAFTVLGVMGPGMFGFGIVVATEREHGLLQLKRALPMPPAANLLARMFMAVLFAVVIVGTMLGVLPIAHLRLSPGQAAAVAVINVLGTLPFCAIGLFIGTRTTSRSAPAFVNILYQLMMHISGLLYPMPGFLRAIAPVWPTWHLQQLTLSATGAPAQGSTLVHIAVLAGVTLVLTTLAVRRLARVG